MEVPCADSSGTMNDAFAWVSDSNNGTMASWDAYPYADADCM